jgi:hypothetical protein
VQMQATPGKMGPLQRAMQFIMPCIRPWRGTRDTLYVIWELWAKRDADDQRQGGASNTSNLTDCTLATISHLMPFLSAHRIQNSQNTFDVSTTGTLKGQAIDHLGSGGRRHQRLIHC